ncbi:hypothetical protein [Amycolatopsis palatopharyngis]|uniref:hypothetical protein n=1 Tax=Amycolatopsis palatopharyngis TaxID=187982 RepID=UPI0013BE9A59|nr:hypothetical protein [Amycolatopsis palatopharyngis]
MSLSADVRQRCAAFLPEGARVRYVFPGSAVTLRGPTGMAGFLVVVTDTEIVVLACGWFRRHRPVSVWSRYPRSTTLGPLELSGSMDSLCHIGSLTLEIPEEFVPVIRAADAELSPAEQHLPPDPFPDL